MDQPFNTYATQPVYCRSCDLSGRLSDTNFGQRLAIDRTWGENRAALRARVLPQMRFKQIDNHPEPGRSWVGILQLKPTSWVIWWIPGDTFGHRILNAVHY
ncbi:hypothetical protein EG68_07084 [Paragonimus skrjabini miyazakii]|uniref:Uncharacterized protein n=1 Tax=Paragonimus skrjabini miyazakii TaxID=59628 RepID=A0A8S9YQS8_9TREM|nr:hypothetical protein EG68_07084 [Paragonimus skrjabini miyazakii]